MIDHGIPTRNGNTGAGLAFGLMDDVGTYHYNLMCSHLNVICPGAQIITVSPSPDPVAGLMSLYNSGCPVIAMPWLLSGVAGVGQYPAMDNALAAVDRAGRLLFAAVGDNLPATGYPASHGSVFSCGAINGDGSPNPLGNTLSGNCAIGVTCGSASEACVMAAAMAVLWLGYGVHTHGDASQRHNGWWHWLTDTGVQSQRGIAPICGRL